MLGEDKKYLPDCEVFYICLKCKKKEKNLKISKLKKKKVTSGSSPGMQWLDSGLSVPWAYVQFVI